MGNISAERQMYGNVCKDNWDEDVYKRYAEGDFDPPAKSDFRVFAGWFLEF